MKEKEEKQKDNTIVINPKIMKQINQINENSKENSENKTINDNYLKDNNNKIIDSYEDNSKLLAQNEEYRKRLLKFLNF